MLWEKHKAFHPRMLADSFCNLIWSYIFKCIYFSDLQKLHERTRKKNEKRGKRPEFHWFFLQIAFYHEISEKLFFLDWTNFIRLQKFEFHWKNKK